MSRSSVDRLARERARRFKSAKVGSKATAHRGPRPFERPRPGELIEVAFVPALTLNNDTAVEQVRKQTHDVLIELLGKSRRSGVRWRHVHGAQDCERVLRLMYEGTPEKWSEVEALFLPFLAEHADDAVMVVAECDARADRR